MYLVVENILVILNFSFSHTSQANQQQILLALLLKYITKLPLFTISTITTLIPVTIILGLNYCNELLISYFYPIPSTVYVLPNIQINCIKIKYISCSPFSQHFPMTPISLTVKATVLTTAHQVS